MEDCVNSDLANNYGNLCQRVISFAEKNCSSLIPDHSFNDDDLKILNSLSNVDKIRTMIDNQDINQYMNFIIDRPLLLINILMIKNPEKNDKLRLSTIVYTALELIRKISILLLSSHANKQY